MDGPSCSALRGRVRGSSNKHGRHPDEGHDEEDRDRSLGRSRGQNQLEHRHGITEFPLEGSERAVPSTDHECCALHEQQRHRGPQVAVSMSPQSTAPHVGQGSQLDDTPDDVCDAKARSAARQGTPGGATSWFTGFPGGRFALHSAILLQAPTRHDLRPMQDRTHSPTRAAEHVVDVRSVVITSLA